MKHGLLDKIVPVEQTLFTSRVLKATSAGLVAAAKAPGVTLSAVGIAVPAANLNPDGTLANGQFGHGDDSYTNGQAVVDLSAINIASSSSVFAGQTPFVLESNWLQGDCAAANLP